MDQNRRNELRQRAQQQGLSAALNSTNNAEEVKALLEDADNPQDLEAALRDERTTKNRAEVVQAIEDRQRTLKGSKGDAKAQRRASASSQPQSQPAKSDAAAVRAGAPRPLSERYPEKGTEETVTRETISRTVASNAPQIDRSKLERDVFPAAVAQAENEDEALNLISEQDDVEALKAALDAEGSHAKRFAVINAIRAKVPELRPRGDNTVRRSRVR